MKFKIETFTPDRCKRELEGLAGINFRKLNSLRAKSYSDDMRRKQWVLNGETIKYGTDGLMFDGYTRFTACVMAGVPFESAVAYGVEKIEGVDAGQSRTLIQWLQHLGFRNCSQLSSLLVNTHLVQEGLYHTAQGRRGSVQEVLKWNALHEDRFADIVKMALSLRLGGATPGTAVFFGTMANFKLTSRSELAREFMSSLHTGVGLSDSNPIHHLRERLIKDRTNKANRMGIYLRRALIIKCWNKHVAGEPVGALGWNSRKEDWPVISDAEE